MHSVLILWAISFIRPHKAVGDYASTDASIIETNVSYFFILLSGPQILSNFAR